MTQLKTSGMPVALCAAAVALAAGAHGAIDAKDYFKPGHLPWQVS